MPIICATDGKTRRAGKLSVCRTRQDAGAKLLRRPALSTASYPRMGQNLGQALTQVLAQIDFYIKSYKSNGFQKKTVTFWLWREDLNLRPPGYEVTGTCLTRRASLSRLQKGAISTNLCNYFDPKIEAI